MSAAEPALAGVRVLDLAAGDADAVTRLLADLGADVLKLEPPGGSPARAVRPSLAGVSIAFGLHNANKRSAVLDPADHGHRTRFFDLVAEADIVVDSGLPGQAAAFGATAAELAEQFGHIVAVTVSDFGTDGPRAAWRATDPVLYALSTALSRSGPPTGTPVLPPDGIASATAAVQAAWATLAGYYHRLSCGTGDFVDFSRFEAVVQALDPPYGAMGQGALAERRSEAWRGRPRNQDVYPIFACQDGYVRTCVMAPRQWHGMRAWLGEPPQFQDPQYDTIGARFRATREIYALTAELFADKTMADLVAAGQSYGVPIAAVLTPADVLASEHFRAVGALADVAIDPGHMTVPSGPFTLDGRRVGLRTAAPGAGAHAAEWLPRPAMSAQPSRRGAVRPFDGLRILDLGIIVAGGELGRLFADLGAEVIKVESAAYPDGLRQTRPGQPMSETFAWTHRNEFGLGLDLRHPEGAAIFSRLVTGADAVFANFKPGTLAALGFPFERLRSLNPRIVLAESSAYGDRGSWSNRMGYGPLVRATTGVTRLWASDDHADPDRPPFVDAVTVFPDHVSARTTAIGALAALIRRDRTGAAAHVHISQADVAINQLDTRYVAEAARARGLPVADDGGEHLVLRCAGDDEWCVVSIRDEDDRRAVATVVGGHGAGELAVWTAHRDKETTAAELQRAGVPAAPMHRPADVLADPQVRHRRLYTDMAHPLFNRTLPTETGPALFHHIPRAELRPAPQPGEHTREVCHKLLGLDAAEIDRLVDDGALFAPPEQRSSS